MRDPNNQQERIQSKVSNMFGITLEIKLNVFPQYF